jgi:hypothetical protein
MKIPNQNSGHFLKNVFNQSKKTFPLQSFVRYSENRNCIGQQAGLKTGLNLVANNRGGPLEWGGCGADGCGCIGAGDCLKMLDAGAFDNCCDFNCNGSDSGPVCWCAFQC